MFKASLFVFFLFSVQVLASNSDCPPPPKAGDPVKIFPLSEIRNIVPGTTAQAYTVFRGSAPECFKVRIDGVNENGLGPGQDAIIFTPISGPAVATNIVHGMSGSPIYLNGMLLGALSRDISLDYTVAPTGAITPAALMIENLEDHQKTQNLAPSMKDLFAGMKINPDLPNPAYDNQPIIDSDDSSESMAVQKQKFVSLNDFLKMKGVDVSTFPWVSAAETSGEIATFSQTQSPEVLAPGSTVVIGLIIGDFSNGASGTVTYNDGKNVLAFGHPFTGAGKVRLPMMTGSVIKIVDSSHESFKIVQAGQIVGTLVEDRPSSIVGVMGEKPPLVPLVAHLTTPAREKTFHAELAQVQNLMPELIATTTFNFLIAPNQAGDGVTYRLKVTLSIKDHGDWTFSQLYTAPNGDKTESGKSLAEWVMRHVQLVTNHPSDPGIIEAVKLDAEVLPDVRIAQLEKITTAKKSAKAGDTLPVVASFRVLGQQDLVTHTFDLTLPADLPHGDISVSFLTSQKYDEDVGSKIASLKPNTSLNDALKIMSEERPNGALYAELSPELRGNAKKSPRSWIMKLVSHRASPQEKIQEKKAEAKPEPVALPLPVVINGEGQSLSLRVE